MDLRIWFQQVYLKYCLQSFLLCHLTRFEGKRDTHWVDLMHTWMVPHVIGGEGVWKVKYVESAWATLRNILMHPLQHEDRARTLWTGKNQIVPHLSNASFVAITTDGWTSRAAKESYVTVIAHLINAEWEMRSPVLHTRPSMRVTQAQIRGRIHKNILKTKYKNFLKINCRKFVRMFVGAILKHFLKTFSNIFLRPSLFLS